MPHNKVQLISQCHKPAKNMPHKIVPQLIHCQKQVKAKQEAKLQPVKVMPQLKVKLMSHYPKQVNHLVTVTEVTCLKIQHTA